MAKTVYTVEMNFKNAAKAADEFISDFDSAVSEALKQDYGFASFKKKLKDVNQIQEDFRKKQKEFARLEDLRQKKNNGEIEKFQKEQEKRLQELNRIIKSRSELTSRESAQLADYNKKLADTKRYSAEMLDYYREERDRLKERANLSDDQIKRLQKEQEELAEHNVLTKLAVANYKAFEELSAGVGKNLSDQADDLRKTVDRLKKSAEFAKKIRESLSDPEEVSGAIEGLADTITTGIKDGIDVQALTRDLGKGIGKGITSAAKHFGGGSMAIGATAGVVAGLVAGMAMLLAAFIAVDKKVKEFNKSVIKTHGALSVMRLGAGNLNQGLKIVKRTVMDLRANFGLSEEEATGLFDALDNGGITLDRITQRTADAARAQELLNLTLREMHKTANVLGVSLADYTNNLTNYVNDLAMSVNTVNDSFAQIAKMASESAFGTRRFYSMVVQATSGQSSLNVSLEQTGDLLMRMSKIMGAKKAAEAVGAAAADMGNLSAQDRIKHVRIGGARGRRRFEVEARQQAGTLAQDVSGSAKQTAALRAALQSSDLTGRGIAEAVQNQDPTRLVTALGRLDQTQQTRLIAQLRDQGTEEAESLARRLDQQISLSRGSRGGMDAMVNSMETFSAGGSIAYKLDEVENLLGGRLENLSATQRAAAENITGMSGHQYDAMRDYSRALQGSFGILQSQQSQLLAQGKKSVDVNSEMDKHLVKMYGATIRDGRIVAAHLSANGEVVADTNSNIRTANDLSQTYSRATGEEISKLKEETTQIAYQTMEATVSVADILENKVAQVIQRLFEVTSGVISPALLVITDWVETILPGDQGVANQARQREGLMRDLSSEIERISRSSTSSGEISRLRVQAESSTSTAEQRRTARDRLLQIQNESSRDQARIQRLRSLRARASEGGDLTEIVSEMTSFREEVSAQAGGELRQMLGIPADGNAPPGTLGNLDQAQAQLAASRQRRGGEAPAPAPTAPAPTAPAPTAPAPAPTAPPAAPPNAPPPARVVAAQNAPVTNEVAEHREQSERHEQRNRRERRQRHQETRQLLRDISKGKELGDGLAESKLPDAIAISDAKMRLLEGLTEDQLRDPALVGRLLGGTATPQDIGGLAADRQGIARALGSRLAPTPNDFIYQNNGGRSVITPINSEDQIMGMKPGGPIANATGRGTGGNVTINVNGGDERRVFEVVRRAIQQAGITPNRVPSGAT